MVFKNIGNFGKKLSEYNAERRDKAFAKLQAKGEKAEAQEKRAKEELKIRAKIEKSNLAKKKVRETKYKPYVDAVKKIEKNINKAKVSNSNGKIEKKKHYIEGL